MKVRRPVPTATGAKDTAETGHPGAKGLAAPAVLPAVVAVEDVARMAIAENVRAGLVRVKPVPPLVACLAVLKADAPTAGDRVLTAVEEIDGVAEIASRCSVVNRLLRWLKLALT